MSEMSEAGTREYRHVDKTGWGEGPWMDEPDKLQWVDEETGLDCLIVRNRLGALCGYVGVSGAHPWHGVDYSNEGDDEHSPELLLDVHGGLTYSDGCMEDVPEAKSICHVPAPGRPDDVWWFGFDCAHSSDFAPAMAMRERKLGLPRSPWEHEHSYKTVDYVRRQCASLARQLARVAERHAAGGALK